MFNVDASAAFWGKSGNAWFSCSGARHLVEILISIKVAVCGPNGSSENIKKKEVDMTSLSKKKCFQIKSDRTARKFMHSKIYEINTTFSFKFVQEVDASLVADCSEDRVIWFF